MAQAGSPCTDVSAHSPVPSPGRLTQPSERKAPKCHSDFMSRPPDPISADGSESRPFRTINRAAALARPGDTVVVHGGEYREWVQPRRGGLSDRRRITYTAAPGEHVVIKGSEPVTGWERVSGDVWTVAVPNALFGTFNPFAEEIDGDWIVYADESTPKKHLGDVYLNGTSFYEVAGVDEVSEPPLRTEMIDNWTGTVDRIRDTRADPTGLVRRGRRRPDDDLGQLRRRGPERRTRRDQRPPLGLLPDRASPRLHHRPRVRARPGRDPVGAADRRPARSDRPELGQGLDHRRQRHPRREVLSGLHRQGDVHRPQLRHPAPRQARLPVPARVGVRRPPDRLGPGAHRLPHRSAATPSTTAARTASSVTSAVCSPPSRTTTSTTSRSSGSSTATRSAASSSTPPST